MNAESIHENDSMTAPLIGAAIEVHRSLGPGLLESVYQKCLAYELGSRGIEFVPNAKIPIRYKGESLDCELFADIVISGQVIIELKAIEKVLPIHEAQLLTYLKLTGISKGLFINFNVILLKDGVKRRKL